MPRRRSSRKRSVSREDLTGLEFFENLDAEVIDGMLRIIDGIEYTAGQEIIVHEDDSSDVFFIFDGTVRVNIYSPSGRLITFELLPAGQMFGELSALDGRERSASCVAESDVFLGRLSAVDYLTTLRSAPDLAEASLRRLAELVRYLCDRVYEFHALPVAQRTQSELCKMATRARAGNENTVIVDPAPSDADIASRVGTTREAVNREINRLVGLGLMRREARALHFLDVETLCEQARI